MSVRSFRSVAAASCLALLVAACAHEQSTPLAAPTQAAPLAAAMPRAPVPPVAAKKPHQVVSPHGIRDDEYYWLRDDTRTSKEVLDYLAAENAYRDASMASTAPLQAQLYAELVKRIKPDDASVPELKHGYWYYSRYEPGKDYPVYARRKGTMTAPEEVMLDGNAMAQGHEFFEIGSWEVSPDSRLIAYTEDDVGRRQFTLRLKSLETGATLEDTVTNVEPNLVWTNDSRTVLYIAKDPVTLLSLRVLQHALGADPATDSLVYEEADHSYYIELRKSRSEQYIFIDLDSTQQSESRFADAGDAQLRFDTVLPREPNHEYQVEQLGKDFIIRTNWQATNFRIVRTPIATRTDKRAWQDVIAQRADAFVEQFEVATDYLAVNERSGGLLKIRIKAWSGGKDILIESAEPAYAMSLVHTPEIDSPTLRYVYSSLTTPATIYDYDMATDAKALMKTDEIRGYDAAGYVTEYLHATARDGAQVPVSVVYRNGTALDGTAPLYQYAYGSYGESWNPTFWPDIVSLLDRGFVVAIAHVRGGQELGRQWYEDGRQLRKKNTFTDFIDVTDYLVKNGYGARDKVFAMGLSAGGLLMGAVANMAPQSYRAIIAHVPFVDIVTTMLDESIPLTTNEFDEWGNPKDKAFYDYMLSYSPYDNVKAQDYPAMLVYTSLWDSQVQYYEPTKWVAKLRATKTDTHPLVFTIDTAAGHGGKSGRFQQYHDTALEYAFILDQLGAGASTAAAAQNVR